jgi:hypothetical protein
MLKSFSDNTPTNWVDVYVSIFSDDIDSDMVVDRFGVKVVYRQPLDYSLGCAYGLEVLLRAAGHYPFYIGLSDDLICHPGWFEAAHRAMDGLGGSGMVALNDTHSDGNEYGAHALVSRKFLIDHRGGAFCSPKYRSWWWDREMTDVAKLHQCYAWAQDSVVEHRNHAWGGIEHDHIYQDAEKNHDNDYRLYMHYKNNGFPVDWEPILR